MLKDDYGEGLGWGRHEFCPYSSPELARGRGQAFSWPSVEAGGREACSHFWLRRCPELPPTGVSSLAPELCRQMQATH